MNDSEISIQKHLSAACEIDLEKYGDTFRGAGYTKTQDDANRCYAVMLNILRPSSAKVSMLDIGCGLAHFYEYMKNNGVNHVEYTGLDISDKYLSVAREKHPEVPFLKLDLCAHPESINSYDYIVMNGLFNYKGNYTQNEMLDYWLSMINIAFTHCNYGIAFNVMSKIVDWERDDLFHLPFDTLAGYVANNLSRNFVIRHDYGMYEYTTYVYKEPCGAPI